MENFTPVSSLVGGMLIGVSAVLFMLLNGRIAGVSGIAGGLIAPVAGDWQWRLAFVLGLICGPLVFMALGGQLPDIQFPVSSTFALAAAGLIVGFGTRLGGGCTSGHGVCGISRLSNRSIVSVFVFMGTGMLTVFVMRQVGGL